MEKMENMKREINEIKEFEALFVWMETLIPLLQKHNGIFETSLVFFR